MLKGVVKREKKKAKHTWVFRAGTLSIDERPSRPRKEFKNLRRGNGCAPFSIFPKLQKGLLKREGDAAKKSRKKKQLSMRIRKEGTAY